MALIQQGDVLFFRDDSVPAASLTEITPANGDIIVMEGETTGHMHRLQRAPTNRIFCNNRGQRFLRIDAETTVTHEEHHPITLRPGIYRIGRVKEWDYFGMKEQEVMD